MTTTARTVQAAHVLIRRVGARSGALHAALRLGTEQAWQTACGELLEDGPRGLILEWCGLDAHAMLAAHTELVCRRCDRVGESVTA